MRLTPWSVALWLFVGAVGQAQTAEGAGSVTANNALPASNLTYSVQGTTADRERVLRSEIAAMQPAVLPYRVLFVPHWQYIYATKMYHLHIPPGMGSKMFTHLPSRSVYIDADLYGGDDWLGYWIAHELGHLEKNSADEHEAERAAAAYRRRLAATAH
jgi:hypothetical protein